MAEVVGDAEYQRMREQHDAAMAAGDRDLAFTIGNRMLRHGGLEPFCALADALETLMHAARSMRDG